MARNPSDSSSTANLGFEAKLWLTVDKLRNNMDANIGQSRTLATLSDTLLPKLLNGELSVGKAKEAAHG